MPGWDYAEIWEVIAEQIPDEPAQVFAGRTLTWRDVDERANGIAGHVLDADEQDKVAQHLSRSPEHLKSVHASFKASPVPVNTSFPYADDELLYPWEETDAVAVVFHDTFTEVIERIRDRAPRVTTWLSVDDGAGPCPSWAVAYETAALSHPERVEAPWGRDGDQLYLLCAGDTTDITKGVVWRHDDHSRKMAATRSNSRYRNRRSPISDLDAGNISRRHGGLT